MGKLSALRPRISVVNLSRVTTIPRHRDGFYASAEWASLRYATLKRDGHTCVLCGARGFIVDHIVSRRSGGKDNLFNLRTLCRSCDNAMKEGVDGLRPTQRTPLFNGKRLSD